MFGGDGILQIISSILAAVLWGISYFYYIRSVRSGVVKPRLGSWMSLAIIDIIAFFVSIQAGVSGLQLTQIVIWMLGATVSTLFIIQKTRTLDIKPFEVGYLLVSVTGFVLSFSLSADVALYMQMAALTIATIPMWKNALHGRESWVFGLITTVGSGIAIGTAVDSADSISYAMPVFGTLHSIVGLTAALIGRFSSPS